VHSLRSPPLLKYIQAHRYGPLRPHTLSPNYIPKTVLPEIARTQTEQAKIPFQQHPGSAASLHDEVGSRGTLLPNCEACKRRGGAIRKASVRKFIWLRCLKLASWVGRREDCWSLISCLEGGEVLGYRAMCLEMRRVGVFGTF